MKSKISRFLILIQIPLLLIISSIVLPIHEPVILGLSNPTGSNILITEVMYDSPASDTYYEWIELYNPTDSSISIEGWKIGDGSANYSLSGLLDTEEYFIIARNSAYFLSQYGFSPNASASFSLSNTGDYLLLCDSGNNAVDYVKWESDDWSLVKGTNYPIHRSTEIDTDLPDDWVQAPYEWGSPLTGPYGNENSAPLLITELLYDAPNSDLDEEWIELYNPTSQAIDLSFWTLNDNYGATGLSGTISANDFFVITKNNTAFNELYGFDADQDSMSIALNNDGDQITLKNPSNEEIDFVAYESGYDNAYPTWTTSVVDTTIRRSSLVDTNTSLDWENSGTLGDPGQGYGVGGGTPLITIITPTEGSEVKGTIDISFSASSEYDITDYNITVDGSLIATTNETILDTTSFIDGAHVINCTAKDINDLIGYKAIIIVINNGVEAGNIDVFFTDPLAGLPYFNEPELQAGNISSGLVSLLQSANQTIEAAIYHLDWQPVIDELLAAHSRGVTVEIAAHGDNLEEFQTLINAGITVTEVTTYNIMHNKFFIIDSLVVWTGSYNPTITGTTHNANDGIQIRGAELAALFQAEFDQLFVNIYGTAKSDNNDEIVQLGSTTIEAYFSPKDTGKTRLIELIDSSNISIYISIFYLTEDDIYTAISNARDRGVIIKGVFDYRAWRNYYSEADEIIEWGNSIVDANPGVYHHKFGVFDGTILWTGSTNWSAAGFEDNDENSIVVHNVAIAAKYIARTEEYYQDAQDYDNSPTQAPRIITRHYSSSTGSNLVTWRTHMNGNVANDLIDAYLIWSWNSSTLTYDFLIELDGATGYYYDEDVLDGVTYYYVITSIAKNSNSMTLPSGEFAQIGIGGDQPVIYPPRDYYDNFGTETDDPIIVMTNPSQSEVINGFIDIAFTANDVSFINQWEIYIDGEFIYNNNFYTWDTTKYSDGTHTITVKATDVFNNEAEETITITIDNSDYVPPFYPSFEAIKIMTYNIEASGENPGWIDVVKEENPDIFTLIETGDLDDNGNTSLHNSIIELNEYFTTERHYSYATTHGMGSKYSGVAILSRFPIVLMDQIPIITLDDGTAYDVSHDFIYAKIEIGTGYLNMIGSHLKASSGDTNEEKREKAQEGILNYIDTLTDPIIYLGDLNSFSPEDTGELAPNGDLGYVPVNMTINSAHPHASANYAFFDAFRTFNPTDPGYSYPQSPYESRIDFILMTSFFSNKIINSTTGDTLSADIGSDHYSVDVTVNLIVWKDLIPPNQVENLTCIETGENFATISWNSVMVEDLAFYRIYRNGTLLLEIVRTTFNDTDIEYGFTYHYTITAVDNYENEGEKSEILQISKDPAVPEFNTYLQLFCISFLLIPCMFLYKKREYQN